MNQKQIIKYIINSYIKTVGKSKFIFILFFGIFVSLIVVLEPLIFTKIILNIENYLKTGIFDTKSTINLIIYWSIFIVFSIFIQYIYDYQYIGKTIMRNFVDESNIYSKKILSMNYSDYLGKKQGSLYKIFDRGTDSHFKFLYFIFTDLIRSGCGVIFVIIIMFSINWLMTIIALSMIPVMGFLGSFFIIKIIPYQKKLNKKWDSVYGKIGNILSGFMLTKTLTLESNYYNSIKNRLKSAYDEQIVISKYWSISTVYTNMVVMISRILVLGFGVLFVINGSLLFAELFLFFSYIGWVYFPLSFIFAKLRDVTEQLVGVEKLIKEFDYIELENINKGKKIKNIKGDIEYKDVEFGYSDNLDILKKISFKIKSGQNIAIVGNTGAGKSTIISLLLRFWDTNNGNILLDGVDLKDISKKSIRDHIGIVTQDISLFNDSILNNLSFANSKATKKDIENALKKAEANFVFKLKDGLYTIIGERGLKLSGGEKQRLSIARLFLKNPEILILDEATSALDNKTEKLIQKALGKLMKGRTSIIIAHRLSTIKNADNIFMIENGRIIESGKYDELVENKGKFYELVNTEHLILS